MITKMHDIVLKDGRKKLREIAQISSFTFGHLRNGNNIWYKVKESYGLTAFGGGISPYQITSWPLI